MTRRLFGEAAAEVGAVVTLDRAAQKHARVLRLDEGATVELFDGSGNLAEAELLAGGRARIVRTWVSEPIPPHLTLVWGMPKPAAVDLGIRMATELGVAQIRLALTERSAPAKGAKLDRWRRIALEATRQSERPTTPTIMEPRPLDVAAEVTADLRLAALARTESRVARFCAADAIAIVVGPEGGLTPREGAMLERELGYQALSLGPHVLRSPTAVAAALTIARAATDVR